MARGLRSTNFIFVYMANLGWEVQEPVHFLIVHAMSNNNQGQITEVTLWSLAVIISNGGSGGIHRKFIKQPGEGHQ
jgi:hypothetical protein